MNNVAIPEGRRAVTLREFCQSFGISYDSAFRAYQDRRLKAIRFGKRVLIQRDEIERVEREGLTPHAAK